MKRALALCAFIVVAAAVAGGAWTARRGDHHTEEAPKEAVSAPTGAPAAAYGAAYRRAPSSGTAAAYAAALLRAGALDDASRLIADPATPFASPDLRATLLGEAAYRAGAFETALADVEAIDAGAPYWPAAAFLRARALYALDPRKGSESAALLRAAFAAEDLAAAAWLFRARIALDANDAGVALSALNRAAEAGAAPGGVTPLRAEARLRAGELTPVVLSAGASLQPAEAQLAGLRAMVRGDYREAVRAFDSIADWLAPQPRGDVLRGLAKLAAGDRAQGAQLLAAYARRSPNDWVARDALVIERAAAGDIAGARRELAVLSELRPAAGALRRAALARAQTDETNAHSTFNETVYEALRTAAAASDLTAVTTAQAFLFGEDLFDLDGAAASPSADGLYASLLAMSLNGPAGERLARRNALADAFERAAAARRTPAHLAIAALAFRAVGDAPRALALLDEALEAAPDFIAAGVLRAEILAEVGELEAARNALSSLLEAAPSFDAARLALVRLLYEGGDASAALAVAAPAQTRFAVDPAAARLYADVAERAGDMKALRAFASEAAKAQGPTVLAGELLLRAGRAAPAADVLRRALSAALKSGETDRIETASGLYWRAMSALDRESEARALLDHLGLAPP